jgi:aliphatic nitrilase
MTPIEGSVWFERLCQAAVTIPGPEVERLCAAARAHGCVVVIGVNERDPRALGTLYNTNIVISADGVILGRHRKLVPTWAEKLTWAGGDGSSLSTEKIRFITLYQ